MAINLEAKDLRQAFNEGTYPSPGWETDARSNADTNARQLLGGLFSALLMTFSFAVCGLAVATALGKVHPSLPFDWGKALSVMGGLLAAWATLFELGGYSETYGGESLHELLRPMLFRAVFLPSLVFATAGQLWWQ